MSQEWLNIQSFFADHKLIGAINDLSIHLKQEMAGVRDARNVPPAPRRPGRCSASSSAGWGRSRPPTPRGWSSALTRRFQSLTDAARHARREPDRFHSAFVRDGAGGALSLLESGEEGAARAAREPGRDAAHHRGPSAGGRLRDLRGSVTAMWPYLAEANEDLLYQVEVLQDLLGESKVSGELSPYVGQVADSSASGSDSRRFGTSRTSSMPSKGPRRTCSRRRRT